jgi:transposase
LPALLLRIEVIQCLIHRQFVRHDDLCNPRMTRRLADAVIQACERLPTLHVAQMFGLHWDTVRLLEGRALQAALSILPKAQPRHLVMDEFALFKGHRYASVVLDADTRRVLWIGEGRSRAAVRPFFEEPGPEGCARVEVMVMDMNTAFDLEVRQHSPNARVVYDLFRMRRLRLSGDVDQTEAFIAPTGLIAKLAPTGCLM